MDSAGSGDDEHPPGYMYGIDWDPNFDTFSKVQFVLEYPFSVLRWLSTPGADKHWDQRRRIWTCISPPFTILAILLDSPWNGNNGFDYLAYGSLGGWDTTQDPPVPKGFSIAAIGVIIGVCIGVVLFLTTNNEKLPVFYPLIVLTAFLSTIMWLDFIANELVAIIEALGRMMNISTSILGLTIIAMGNSVGDLVADTSTARNISPKMGVASCFGSPLLNDILGIGVATVIKTAGGSPVASPLNAQDRLAYVFLFTSLISSAIVFPLCGYRSDKKNFFSFGLFTIYGLFMLFSCLVEFDVISKAGICKWGGNYQICLDTSE
jgi:sodium/potassium/calcium exchanger 6